MDDEDGYQYGADPNRDPFEDYSVEQLQQFYEVYKNKDPQMAQMIMWGLQKKMQGAERFS